MLKRHLAAFRGERESDRGCISSQVLVRNKKYCCCWVCSCFSEEGATLLTTSFVPSLLIKALHEASNYRASVLLGSTLGKCCLCGRWFPKIDVDSHCVYSIKTTTAAVGEFQHRDFCRACTLHKHNKKYPSHHNFYTQSWERCQTRHQTRMHLVLRGFWLFQVPVRRSNTNQEVLFEYHIQQVGTCIRSKIPHNGLWYSKTGFLYLLTLRFSWKP